MVITEFLIRLLSTYESYVELREDGVPAEDARHLLPNATKTEVYTTFNLRQWRHFLTMRLDKHAQWEIKRCAGQVWDFLKREMPLLLEGLKSHSGASLSPVGLLDYEPGEADPIRCFPTTEEARMAGESLPGWYFFEENWIDLHGPFGTRDLCAVELKIYCDTNLG